MLHCHIWDRACLQYSEIRFTSNYSQTYCFTRASLVVQTVKNLPAIQETWVQSLGQEDALEKGMANHSSILSQRTQWTEEPGGLQSTGLHRVGQNRNNLAYTHVMFPGLSQWLNSKEFAFNAGDTGDTGSIPGSGRCPGGGHGNPLQYSCLENPMDRVACGLQSTGLQRVGHD